jgi:predicted oxidoreductase (fatty acid repression mutant protein)
LTRGLSSDNFLFMTDKEIIKYLRKQSKMWETNFNIVSNKFVALYVKFNKLKSRKEKNL